MIGGIFISQAKEAGGNSVGKGRCSHPSCSTEHLCKTAAPECGAVGSNRHLPPGAVLAPSPARVPSLASVQYTETSAVRCSQNGYQ